MLYLFDTDALLQSANFHYPLHIFPGFWSWLDSGIASGWARSVNAVYQEIDYPEELKEWVDLRRDTFFIDVSDINIQQTYKMIAGWVTQKYVQSNSSDFLKGADPWLIATALVKDASVVTQETRVSPDAKKVKIPNVCSHFQVDCINVFELLKERNPVFDLR